MNKIVFIFVIVLLSAVGLFAQPAAQKGNTPAEKPAAAAVDTVSLDLAKAALAAQGGDKLKAMKSFLAKGSADVNAMGQAMPCVFSTAFSGEKYFFELNMPTQDVKQVFDGRRTFFSIDGISLPPLTSIGFPVLARIGDPGYVISAPADAKKKGKGFRVTTPEGFYTDFFIDEKTKQIKGYESAYDMGGGQTATTSVEIDTFVTVDGVLVPNKYSQRFNLGQLTAYVDFKVKVVKINPAIDDSAFTMSK